MNRNFKNKIFQPDYAVYTLQL